MTSFDSVVLAAIVRELATWVGSRVVRVVYPAPDEIAVDLRGPSRKTTMLCSIDARWARVHLTSKSARADSSPFTQLLHSRLDAAHLIEVQQAPFERILRLTFRTARGRADLIAEIMGRHSNLIFVEDGVIAGSLKSVPRTKSTVREVLPGRPYVSPPQARASPASLDLPALTAILISCDEPLSRCLGTRLMGLGPALAEEIAVRAGAAPDAPARDQIGAAAGLWEAVHAVAVVVERGSFSPVVYYDGREAVGFAPFPFMHFASLRAEPASTMSAAVEMVLGRMGATARLDDQRTTLLGTVRTALARVERTVEDVQRAIEEATRTSRLRQQGELLLAYAATIPAGAPRVTVPGFDGTPVTIELDSSLSAVENAQRLFKRYGRVRAARPTLEARLRAASEERTYLESVGTLIDQATTPDDLADLRAELASQGYLRTRKAPVRTSSKTGPRQFLLADGSIVLVGRTNRENDLLTFKVGSAEDLWLHARGTPGAHVILKRGRHAPSEDSIQQAAAIAAYFSKAREAPRAEVDYTSRKHVRKLKGARPGLVMYTQERTVSVRPGLPAGQSAPGPTSGVPQARRR